jgi:hypothetical protein
MSANGEQIEEKDEIVEQRDVSGVLEQLTRGEIDAQVRTAKAYPRSLKVFINEALNMATLDEKTAESCFYSLPARGGNEPIEGPSARLAEIIASAWGNCRFGARTVEEGDRFVTAQGFFFDVQRNSAVAFEVRRRITNKYGKRYNDDMIGVTANAACSIALRNAVFKGIPKALWQRVYEAARQTAIGDAKTLEAKRGEMIRYFGKMGVQPDRLLTAVGVKSLEDIGLDQLGLLKGLATAIKEGDTTIEQAFPLAGTGPSAAVGAVKLEDVLHPSGTAARPSTQKRERDDEESLA